MLLFCNWLALHNHERSEMKHSAELKTITPAEASKFLEINEHEGQRHLSRQTVEQYVRKLGDGRFHVGSIAVWQDNGHSALMDGQHQCTACVQSGIPFQAVVQKFVPEKGDGKSAKAKVFSQFNVDRPRSAGQVVWNVAATSGMGHMTRRCAGLCATALSSIQAGKLHTHDALSKDERAELILKNRKDCEFVHEVAFSATYKHLWRSPVVQAMIEIRRTAGDKSAREFWESVAVGEMLKTDSPAYKLREYLKNVTVRSAAEKSSNATPREMYVKCIHAWNAHVSGKSTTLKYFQNADIPEIKS